MQPMPTTKKSYATTITILTIFDFKKEPRCFLRHTDGRVNSSKRGSVLEKVNNKIVYFVE
jgi:hypothetical protein